MTAYLDRRLADAQEFGDLLIRTGSEEFIVFARPNVPLWLEDTDALEDAMSADGIPGAMEALGETVVGHRAQQFLFGPRPAWQPGPNPQPPPAMFNCATVAIKALGQLPVGHCAKELLLGCGPSFVPRASKS